MLQSGLPSISSKKLLLVQSFFATGVGARANFKRNWFILLVSRDNTFLFRLLSKIPSKSRHERWLITLIARSESADEKIRHEETKQQLSDVCRRFSESESQPKISGAQLQDTLNSLAVIQHQHSRTETQVSIAQRALSDLQEFAVDAQKFKEEASALRAERITSSKR